MKFNRLTLTPIAAAVSLIVMGGAVQAATVPADVTLADDQTFTYRLLSDITTFDPGLVEDRDSSDVIRNLFEGLLNQDADGNLIPGVAESYTTNDNKTVYTFKLRDNAKWSNGDAVTAHDFVYAWQRAADPATASPYAWYVELTDIVNAGDIVAGEKAPSELGVQATDDHTLVVNLNKSSSYFDQMVTHATLYPVHKATLEAHGQAWTKPENMVGNGAYTLTEFVPSQRSVMKKNETYWDAANTVLETIVTRTINDETAAYDAYVTNEINKTELPAGQFKTLSQKHGDEIVTTPDLCTYYYEVNLSDSGNAALKNVDVRMALSLALDRDVITQDLLGSGQQSAYSFTPPSTAGFSAPETPAATMTQAERDAKAKELIEAANLDAPLSFKLLYNTSESHKKIAVLAASMWKQKLGAQVELENMEWASYLEARSTQQHEIARAGWCGDYN
ncbi:MAG: peptide ABC transporter substrate-binding protein, partial [Gammaproteobacteria bacterium]|nr:peptide ABC transporter substrate-binding protein [Gammaproteobacteria bacterium]